MIDLYTWPTANGHKVHIMLEECGLAYKVHPVDILAGDQFAPDFLKISPNNKMPAIIDQEGPDGAPIAIFESGAILIYLAEKMGHFLPTDPRGRCQVIQWLMFQMGGLGPMLGQAHHFLRYAPEDIPYAKNRYRKEANRLYGVMDRRLADSSYLAGEDYSIADMAAWPWTRSPDRQGVDSADFPHFQRWFDQVSARPAVQKAITVLQDRRRDITADKEAQSILFGDKQYERH
jgi:GST-like protein